jgi:hypothetical protein
MYFETKMRMAERKGFPVLLVRPFGLTGPNPF